jgi:hypothetical protein
VKGGEKLRSTSDRPRISTGQRSCHHQPPDRHGGATPNPAGHSSPGEAWNSAVRRQGLHLTQPNDDPLLGDTLADYAGKILPCMFYAPLAEKLACIVGFDPMRAISSMFSVPRFRTLLLFGNNKSRIFSFAL